MKLKTVIKTTAVAVLAIAISACGGRQGSVGSSANNAAQGAAGIFEGADNIGGVKLIGRMVYDAPTQTYTLSGGGINVWGNLDQHFYAWKKLSGDFSMTTKLAFEGVGVVAHRKAGIMIREALTGESRCVHISVHGDGLTSLQYRKETAGITQEVVGPKNGDYITLEKVGKKIRMKTATGVLPTEVTGEVEMDFAGEFYVGLFVCSHDADVLETVHFTNVEFKQ
jgi:hypothetical protein